MKVPTVAEAEAILKEASEMNPGEWVRHNAVAGMCAGSMAKLCPGMDPDAAHVMGLLHDVGRRMGACDMKHILFGYQHMIERGYEDSARVCLTHSFPIKAIESYNGENDCNREETDLIRHFIGTTEYDDYDRLVQLCDALSYPTGATLIEKRLVDVALRKGFNAYTLDKWKAFFKIKAYFESRMGTSVYDACRDFFRMD